MKRKNFFRVKQKIPNNYCNNFMTLRDIKYLQTLNLSLYVKKLSTLSIKADITSIILQIAAQKIQILISAV